MRTALLATNRIAEAYRRKSVECPMREPWADLLRQESGSESTEIGCGTGGGCGADLRGLGTGLLLVADG